MIPTSTHCSDSLSDWVRGHQNQRTSVHSIHLLGSPWVPLLSSSIARQGKHHFQSDCPLAASYIQQNQSFLPPQYNTKAVLLDAGELRRGPTHTTTPVVARVLSARLNGLFSRNEKVASCLLWHGNRLLPIILRMVMAKGGAVRPQSREMDLKLWGRSILCRVKNEEEKSFRKKIVKKKNK